MVMIESFFPNAVSPPQSRCIIIEICKNLEEKTQIREIIRSSLYVPISTLVEPHHLLIPRGLLNNPVQIPSDANNDIMLILPQGVRRESAVPDLPSVAMRRLVACGVDGEFREEDVIPIRFAAFGSWSVDGVEDVGVEDCDFLRAFLKVVMVC